MGKEDAGRAADDERDRLVENGTKGFKNEETHVPGNPRRCLGIALVITFLLFVAAVVSMDQRDDNQSPSTVTVIANYSVPTFLDGENSSVSSNDGNGVEQNQDDFNTVEHTLNNNGNTTETDSTGEHEDDETPSPKAKEDAYLDAYQQIQKDLETEGTRTESPTSKASKWNTQAPTPRSKQVKTVWDLNLKEKRSINPRPGLVFVKAMKVGGTSVALALNRAALHYKFKLATVSYELNKIRNQNVPSCEILRGGTLYFRHGYKNAWQKQCIADVKYLALLRDPLSQQISFEAYILHREYFVRYPREACTERQFVDVHTQLAMSEVKRRLATVTECNDTPYRRNLTIIYVANRFRNLREEKDPGTAIEKSFEWMTDALAYKDLTSERIIDYLSKEYFMVGATERINQFLVLVALAHGWDLTTVYYKRCKVSNLDVPRQEFQQLFPELAAKVIKASEPAEIAYKWALKQFDDHVAKLGDWFPAKVKEFETGLREFQSNKRPDASSYQWQTFLYADGHEDQC